MKAVLMLLRACWLALLVILVGAGVVVYALLRAPQATPWLASQAVLFSQGLIPIARVSGSLLSTLAVEELVIDTESVRVEIRDAKLDWRAWSLLARTIQVQALDAASVRLIVKDRPPQPTSDALTRLPLSLDLRSANIARFELVVQPATEPLLLENIRLRADWTGDEIRLHEAAVHFAPLGAAQLEGLLRLHPRAIQMEALRVQGWGDIVLDTRIEYDGLHFKAAARWDGLRWPQQGDALVRSAQGRLEAEGQWQDYRFDFKGPVESLAAGFPLRALLALSGRGSLSGIDVVQSDIQTLAGEADVQGSLQWKPNLALKLAGDFARLDPGSLNAQWPGQLNGQFDVRWLPEDASPKMDLTLALQESQLRGFPVQLDAAVTMRDGQWALPKLLMGSGRSQLRASGDVSPRLLAEATLNSGDLSELWPDLSGKGTATVKAKGSLDLPRLDAQATLEQVSYPGVTIRRLALNASLHEREPSRVSLQLEDVRAGVAMPSLSLDASGTAAQHQIELKAQTELGDMRVGLGGALDLARKQWQGELKSGSGRPVRLPEWTLQEPAALIAQPSRVSLAPACWKSLSGRACMQFHQRPEELRGAFRLEQLAFAYFEPLLPPEWRVTGDLSGTGLVVYRAGGLTAEVDLRTSAGQIKLGDHATLGFKPSELRVEDTAQGLRSELNMPLEQGQIAWQAHLSPARAAAPQTWSGQMTVALSDLAVLQMLSPEIESVKGRLDARFNLSGAMNAPRLQGEAVLRDGQLSLYTPGIKITAIQAVLRSASDTGRYTLEAAASSGGGSLSLKGTGVLGDQAQPLRLELAGEGFQIVRTPMAQVWVSPQLTFEWLKDQATLTGEVQVPRARITPKEINQGVTASRDQIIVRSNDAPTRGGTTQLTSAVKIRLGDEVWFDGLGLKTRLTGALDAMDDAGRPTRARGQINLAGGSYKAYGQDLTIETGRLIFTGGAITEPAVEIRATRKPTEEITVGVSVRGTLDAPQFTLFSLPALPQEQQLSWLVLGRSLEGGGNSAEQSVLAGAALSLGLTGGDYLAQRVRGGLRLDEISIGAKPGESSDRARLTVGKYLSPKLYVSYGIGLFQPGHTFRLQYDIGHGFKLSTETGVESGGDLLYTVEH